VPSVLLTPRQKQQNFAVLTSGNLNESVVTSTQEYNSARYFENWYIFLALH